MRREEASDGGNGMNVHSMRHVIPIQNDAKRIPCKTNLVEPHCGKHCNAGTAADSSHAVYLHDVILHRIPVLKLHCREHAMVTIKECVCCIQSQGEGKI
jgi:hypothetical protein